MDQSDCHISAHQSSTAHHRIDRLKWCDFSIWIHTFARKRASKIGYSC